MLPYLITGMLFIGTILSVESNNPDNDLNQLPIPVYIIVMMILIMVWPVIMAFMMATLYNNNNRPLQ